MTTVSTDYLSDQPDLRVMPVDHRPIYASRSWRTRTRWILLLLSILLLGASIGVYSLQNTLLAASQQATTRCGWYTIESGDTLTNIARHYHITTLTLAHANAIANTNLIFVGQRLCIPSYQTSTASGITANGVVRWYAYNALGWSDRSQVRQLLYQVAARHHLPARLLLAIAWQESGWTQHVIAWDGGIGVMQLMPYTAMGINAGIRAQLDPYDLYGNLDLGATYLQWLWQNFHGDLPKVISAYNEGGWAVKHCGIYNWHYVNNVMALMHNLN